MLHAPMTWLPWEKVERILRDYYVLLPDEFQAEAALLLVGGILLQVSPKFINFFSDTINHLF